MVGRINFLVKETRGLTYRNYIQIIVALCILCAAVYFIQVQLHKSYVKEVEFMQQEIARIRASQKALLKKKPKKIAIGTQERVASKIRVSAEWPSFLNDIARVVPKELWLSEIQISLTNNKDDEEQSIFLIEGYCYRANVPPKFVSRLQKLSRVRSVKNLGTDRGESEMSNLFKFQIQVTLRNPKENS